MKFEEALTLMRIGYKVRRPKWPKDKYWCIGDYGGRQQLLHCDRKGDSEQSWDHGIQPYTLLEEDWEIYTEV